MLSFDGVVRSEITLRGQQIERGQRIAVAGSARGHARGRAAARRRGCGFVLVFFFRLSGGRHGDTAEAVEAWLLTAVRRRRRGGAQRSARRTAQQTAEACLPAQQGVHDHAEPGGGAVVAGVLVLDIIALGNRRLLGARVRPAHSGGDGERHDGGEAEQSGQHDERQPRQRRAQQQGRHMQQRIAQHAAQAGRQRPGADARQRGGEGGGQDRRRDPHQAAPFVAERPVRQQPPAEQRFRQQQLMLAKPSNCIARSEKMAPGKPSRLWIGFCVAWLSEGSCTDQVASAMAPSSPSVSSASPASSLRRRRTMSRKCSETKATMSRLRSAAGMSYTR